MSEYTKLTGNIEGCRLVNAHWPKPGACNSAKCGEFNMLRCVREKGHAGDHNYAVDHKNDYPHRRKPQ